MVNIIVQCTICNMQLFQLLAYGYGSVRIAKTRRGSTPVDEPNGFHVSGRMVEFPTARHVDAKHAFVSLLLEAKEAVPAASYESKDGPNKAIARSMKVSPARLTDFLDANFTIGKEEHIKNCTKPRLKKLVMGFAESVQRAVLWLRSERNVGKRLNAELIVGGYWPHEAGERYDSTIQQAIHAGVINAKRRIVKEDLIDVTLKIIAWGPFAIDEDVEKSFFAHYGRTIFRGIDPLRTRIKVTRGDFDDKYKLSLRSAHGDWTVSMGPYETLERRFRGLEFVVFPALRFPLLGLIISQKAVPNNIQFDFAPIAVHGSDVMSLFDTHPLNYGGHTIPRFVADVDEVGKSALYAMFGKTEDAEHKSYVRTLPADDANGIANLLLDELADHTPTVAFVGDGMLTFQVFQFLHNSGVQVKIVAEEKPNTSFSLCGGIMFRQEDHPLAQLLEDAQRQLFRFPRRVVGLLNVFLREIDSWISMLQNGSKRMMRWPEDKPLFVYPHHEVADYIAKCVAPDRGGQIHPDDPGAIAEHIFLRVLDSLSEAEEPRENEWRPTNVEILGKLFQSTGSKYVDPSTRQGGSK